MERILGDSIVDETDAFVDNTQSIKVDRQTDFEWARLRLLDTKIVDEMLSSSEIAAVTAHLKTNYSACFKLLTDVQLARLVSNTPVTTFPTATQELGQALPGDLLYKKDIPADVFTLILSGKVTIFVGSEDFRSDLSSWSVIGKSALEQAGWKPDFSAFVSDGPCRCIQITHAAFAEAVDASAMERRIAESRVGTAALSYASEMGDATSIGESAHSMASSTDGPVPNRRGNVLARLFREKPVTSAEMDENVEEHESPSTKAATVQFDDRYVAAGGGDTSDNNERANGTASSSNEQNGDAG